MNHADIEVARRLIAQFEGNALGRHNSNQFNRRQDLQSVPEQRRIIHTKPDPQKCEVGDYCWNIGLNVPINQMTVMVLKDKAPSDYRIYEESWVPTPEVYTAMEFERVRVMKDGRRTTAWHRIA